MQQIPDKAALLRMAQSQAGKQLIQLLQQSGGKELSTAIEKAAAGNYQDAKAALSSLLSTPEAQQLIKQMEANT